MELRSFAANSPNENWNMDIAHNTQERMDAAARQVFAKIPNYGYWETCKRNREIEIWWCFNEDSCYWRLKK